MATPLHKKLYWLLLVSLICYLPVLTNLQYVGEESVYTLMSYEMKTNNSWLTATMYGEAYWRPPLFNWLIIAGSNFIGWEYSLEVARLISILATFSSTLAIFFFSKRINLSNDAASINAIIFATCWQISCNYGWLGYSDALFNAFVTMGILCAILTSKEKNVRWFLLAMVCAFLGMLTKALTGYIHILAAFIITSFFYKKNGYAYAFKIFFLNVFFWSGFYLWKTLSPSGLVTSQGAITDITEKLNGFLNAAYLSHLIQLPVTLLINMAPWSILLLWVIYHQKKTALKNISKTPIEIKLMAWIFLSIFLPYLIAPHGHSRYLLPAFMPASFVAGHYLYQAVRLKYFMLTCIAIISFKLIYLGWLFPFYTKTYRPNIHLISAEISEITEGHDIYANDGGWVGIAIVDQLNQKNMGKTPIRKYSNEVDHGFIINNSEDSSIGPVVKNYKKTYLLCKGNACKK